MPEDVPGNAAIVDIGGREADIGDGDLGLVPNYFVAFLKRFKQQVYYNTQYLYMYIISYHIIYIYIYATMCIITH